MPGLTLTPSSRLLFNAERMPSPDVALATLPGSTQHYSYAEWFPSADSTQPGAIQLVQSTSRRGQDTLYDPEGVIRLFRQFEAAATLIQSPVVGELLQKAGLSQASTHEVFDNNTTIWTHQVRFPAGATFVELGNAALNEEFGAMATQPFLFGACPGKSFDAKTGVARIGHGEWPIGTDPEVAGHDTAFHGAAVLALARTNIGQRTIAVCQADLATIERASDSKRAADMRRNIMIFCDAAINSETVLGALNGEDFDANRIRYVSGLDTSTVITELQNNLLGSARA